MSEENKNCDKSSCSTCPSAGKCNEKEKTSFLVEGNEASKIKRIIGIVSGKGGVGKSTTTCLIARKLSEVGYSVGILDADITGPSIPRMMGVDERPEESEVGIIPPMSSDGIKVMSMNLLLDSDEAPVIWRGPVIAGFVKQFYTDVCWGDIDFLLVDMPPGTGDVPLTVFQSLPLDGIVLVTSPQSLVGMIVAKAYNMAARMDIPVLGIVENYSYYQCPDCGRKEFIFGESHVDEYAAQYGVPVIAKLPIDPVIARLADEGRYFATEADIDIKVLTDGLFDAILFDLDGTLSDPKEGICSCVAYAAKEVLGIDEPDLDKLEDFIGPPLREHFMERYNVDFDTATKCVAKYRERYTPIGLFENVMYDGMDTVLADLKSRGYKLAVATSKPETLAVTVLEHFGIAKYFDVIAGSELNGDRTVKSEVITYALGRLREKYVVNSPLMIGDRKHDVIGAKECNIPCVGVLYGYGSMEELIEAGADYIVGNVLEIGDLL